MRKILLVVLCTLASCFKVAAQEDSKYEAALDEAVGMSCNKAAFLKAIEGTYSDLFKNNLTDEDCHAMSVELVDFMYPITVNMVKDLWRPIFSYDELKQITEWLSSPVGQKMLNAPTNSGELLKQLIMDPEYMQGIVEITRKYMR
ncbi:MAG: DUF2059 domain-containing protein [Muribaculaceae bacterium]|nr:DUF2059 domain-containing protein [Muribaculaceae bacterium]